MKYGDIVALCGLLSSVLFIGMIVVKTRSMLKRPKSTIVPYSINMDSINAALEEDLKWKPIIISTTRHTIKKQ